MANTPTFVDHALDLLSLAGPVEARRMFGGHGLYVGGAMFGLLDDDELFLKTDAETRSRFVEAGCKAWVYPRRDGRVEQTSYFQPPDGAHEEPEAMLPWARLAVDAALRARAAKEARARKDGKARAPGKRTTARPAKRTARRAR
ncbi:TfoX/Sxy family protein [Anaeromyxobacter terrae]|uniref:TfoX/Sxy family protein n=1 Tax=Anaeromyxobacter terrae TaxID=2925406 RepID=UPI001F571D4F|nr:TfoX/Sxy family protein [Anaeromyxobacter sp. SG22]